MPRRIREATTAMFYSEKKSAGTVFLCCWFLFWFVVFFLGLFPPPKPLETVWVPNSQPPLSPADTQQWEVVVVI